MDNDRYTRIVLTVIAVCLVWIVAREVELVKPAQASSDTIDVNIVKVAGMPLRSQSKGFLPIDPALPVRIID